VSAAGGAPVAATTLAEGETAHVAPAFLSDGRHFAYRALKAGDAGAGPVYVAALDSPDRTLLLNNTSLNVAFMRGHVLFARELTLMAQPFDGRRWTLTGEAAPVVEHMQVWGRPITGVFAASDAGVLVYQTADTTSLASQLTWFDRTGRAVGVLGEPDAYGDVELSPSGTQAVVSLLDTGLRTRDLWVFDLARGLKTRFTSDRAEEATPIWSPDGSRIAFTSYRSGTLELYQKVLNGVGTEDVLLVDRRNKYPASWSPDGRFVMYMVDDGERSGWDLWVLPLFGDRKPFPFLQTPFNEVHGQFSPDGRWVAFVSNESGRYEVYVAPFQGPGRIQVSSGGGQWPRWRHDGQELFYLAPDDKLMGAPTNGRGPTFEVGAVRALFNGRPQRVRSPYSPSLDGQRFLVNALAEQTPRPASRPDSLAPVNFTPLTVVVNWTMKER
jgi:hypothetical protein